jgi:murein L,D-transpeptidase YcbB/YkuD
MVENERIHDLLMLGRFYKKRDFKAAWFRNELLLPQADDLVDAIKESYQDGLTPRYYHLDVIQNLTEDIRKKPGINPGDYTKRAELDLLLTDAFFLLSCHLSSGCVNPVALQAKWFAHSEWIDVAVVLEKALKENRIREALRNLIPPYKIYSRLRQALAHYRALVSKGGWQIVSDGPALKKGDNDSRVIELKRRLAVSGDISSDALSSEKLFDEALEQAVRKFQMRHALKSDGVVGPKTLKALNIPADKRARQIELNLERLRWSFRNLGRRYILVNIADFSLDVVEARQRVLSMKVVVGKPYWHTPVFSAEMTYLVMNPDWNVPKSIAVRDILPKIKKDPDYLSKKNFTVLSGWEDNPRKINPEMIDWSVQKSNNFPYRLRQEPGIKNPLGRVKFMFPNKFNVYLHDTPHKGLFERTVRSFSHGCIRLSKPIDLAEYLLQDDENWSRDKILAAFEKGEKKAVRLPEPINVHLLYLTAWLDDDGNLQFREDIYGRDRRLDSALSKKPHSNEK